MRSLPCHDAGRPGRRTRAGDARGADLLVDRGAGHGGPRPSPAIRSCGSDSCAATAELRARMPEQVAEVERLLARYDAELAAAGLAPENLLESRLTPGMVVKNASIAIATLLVLAPLAVDRHRRSISVPTSDWSRSSPARVKVRTRRDRHRKDSRRGGALPAGVDWRSRWLVWRRWGLALADRRAGCCCRSPATRRCSSSRDSIDWSAQRAGLSLRLFRPARLPPARSAAAEDSGGDYGAGRKDRIGA